MIKKNIKKLILILTIMSVMMLIGISQVSAETLPAGTYYIQTSSNYLKGWNIKNEDNSELIGKKWATNTLGWYPLTSNPIGNGINRVETGSDYLYGYLMFTSNTPIEWIRLYSDIGETLEIFNTETGGVVSTIKPIEQSLSVTINPSPIDATCVINGVQGKVLTGLLNGTYDYSVSKDGYQTQTGTITIFKYNVTQSVTLTQIPTYSITLNTIPADATCVVNGITGNVLTGYENGSYPYTISKEGYVTQTGTIIVNGENVTQNITLEVIPTYAVTISTVPVDATIIFNGQEEAQVIENVLNGTYPYTITRDGYKTKEGSITVNGGNVTLNITMEEIPVFAMQEKTPNDVVLGVNGTIKISYNNDIQTVSVTGDGYVSHYLSGKSVYIKTDIQENQSIVLNVIATDVNGSVINNALSYTGIVSTFSNEVVVDVVTNSLIIIASIMTGFAIMEIMRVIIRLATSKVKLRGMK